VYKEIFKNTFEAVFEKKEILFKALFFPSVLIIGLNTLFMEDFSNVYVLVPVLILIMLINITIAISTHRILLLEQNQINTWALFHFTKTEFEYLKATLTLSVIAIVSMFIALILFGIPFWLISLFVSKSLSPLLIFLFAFSMFMYVAIIISRISLIFPSIALNKKLSLSESWEKTKNYKFLCFLVIMFVPIVFTLGLEYLFDAAFEMSQNVEHIINASLGVFLNVFMISSLSHSYKYILSNEENTNKSENEVAIKTIKINNYDPIELKNNSTLSFEALKEDLKSQYFILGLSRIAVDKEDSFMLKNEEEEQSYVSLEKKNNSFILQSFNVEEPSLKILQEKDRL